jgi:hypothetical protein
MEGIAFRDVICQIKQIMTASSVFPIVSNGLGGGGMHRLPRHSRCCCSAVGSASHSLCRHAILSLCSVSRCMFRSVISRLLSLSWECAVSSSASFSCHCASALIAADQLILDLSHLMHEIDCRHHLSTHVVRAVMACTGVLGALVAFSNTLSAPRLSWGAEASIVIPTWISPQDLLFCVAWSCDHAVLGWCPSTALAFVLR